MSLYTPVKCGKCGDERQMPTSVVESGADYCPVCKPRTPADRAYRNEVIQHKRAATRARNSRIRAAVFYAKPGTHPACYMWQVGQIGGRGPGTTFAAFPCDPRTGKAHDPGARPTSWRVVEVREVGGQRLHVLEAW